MGKRIRKVKTLAYIIGYLKSQMPSVYGKDKKQQKLITDLPNVFRTILKKYNLSAGDFPDINKFSAKLNECKFADFNSLNTAQIDGLDACLNSEIPKLMEELPSEKDTPDTLKAKMGESYGDPQRINVPMPTRAEKFGKGKNEAVFNPFGVGQDDTDNYWALKILPRDYLINSNLLDRKEDFYHLKLLKMY